MVHWAWILQSDIRCPILATYASRGLADQTESSYLLWVLLNLGPGWSLMEVNLWLWLSVSDSLVLHHQK